MSDSTTETKATLIRFSLGVAVAGLASIASAPSGAASTDFWVGSTTPPSLWVSPDTTTNWLSSTVNASTVYHDGDNVEFEDQYTYTSPPATVTPNSFTVTIGNTVSPGSVLVSTDTALNPADQYVFTGSGTIAGTTSLTLAAGTLNIMNSAGNAYSGGTTVNGGTLLANSASGSSTGTSTVTVNATGTLGGSGSVGGATTIASGGFLAPSANPTPPPATTSGAATNLTFQNALTLASGAGSNYNLNQPNVVGTGGGNDLTTVNGNLSLNHNLTLDVTAGSSFGSGTYALLHYNTLTNNSGGFAGWNTAFENASLPTGMYTTTSFVNDKTHDNIDLKVSTSSLSGPAPVLGKGSSTSFVIPASTTINNSNVNSPVAKITGNSGAGGPTASFYLARGPAPSAKGFSIGWSPVTQMITPGTPVFAPNGQHVAYPVSLGGTDIPISPNPPYRTNPPFDCPVGCGKFPPTGAYYPAGTSPGKAPPDDWLPAYRLAPIVTVTDPPTAAVPTYYGETFKIPAGFNDPNGLGDVFLADQVNGEDFEPDTLDTLSPGADDKFNYRGSFLSLVQQDFPSITDLSELTSAQWDLFDGSFGVDTANSIAWAVDDIPDANYTVVARSATVAEPGTITILGAALIGFGFLRRRKFIERAQ